MLERIKGQKTHRLSGEQLQTIGRSLFYKRLDLIRGGKGEGEPTGYDTVRGRIRAQIQEEIWEPDSNYTVVLNRRERRLANRALKFVARNPGPVTEHVIMQTDTPRLDANDSGLGIAESQQDKARNEARYQATKLALAAITTRQALADTSIGHVHHPVNETVAVRP